MALAGHDPIKQSGGLRADSLSPFHQAGGRPLQMPLMRLRPVLADCSGAVRRMTPRMTGHTQSAMKDLHGRGGGAHFHILLGELIGHAVPVVLESHVIVDVDRKSTRLNSVT